MNLCLTKLVCRRQWQTLFDAAILKLEKVYTMIVDDSSVAREKEKKGEKDLSILQCYEISHHVVSDESRFCLQCLPHLCVSSIRSLL